MIVLLKMYGIILMLYTSCVGSGNHTLRHYLVITKKGHKVVREMGGFYFYCGSIVAGGLLDTAYVTQVAPSTSFVILLLILSINS